MYKKPITSVKLNGETFTASSSDWERKIGDRMSTITIFSILQDILANMIKKEKGITIAKEEVKLSWFANGLNFYVENPKESTNY